jgi:hypothetical protein
LLCLLDRSLLDVGSVHGLCWSGCTWVR